MKYKHKLLYKFASRSRPTKFIDCIENIYINKRHDNFFILASLDLDDTTMNNPEMKAKMKGYDRLYPVFGTSKNKVDAINRDMTLAPEWDVLVNISDDMLFCAHGFDLTILDRYQDRLPDGDCLLHFPDQNQGKNCMTMSIMDKKYYERDNFIYDPRCESLWSDVIAQETGQMRGRYSFLNTIIFHHNHPSFYQCSMDKQYEKTESWEVREHDYDVYLRAKKEYDPNNTLPIRPI